MSVSGSIPDSDSGLERAARRAALSGLLALAYESGRCDALLRRDEPEGQDIPAEPAAEKWLLEADPAALFEAGEQAAAAVLNGAGGDEDGGDPRHFARVAAYDALKAAQRAANGSG